MANVTTARIVRNAPRELVLRLTGRLDSDEASASKLVRANTDVNGAVPSLLNIRALRWCMQGMNSIQLQWDHAAPDTIYQLSGSGYDEPDETYDPASAGGTGDLKLMSFGVAAANATYDITLWINKRP